MMSQLIAEDLARQLEDLDNDTIGSLPESVKSRLYTATRNCSLALESPTKVVERILLTQPSEAIYVRIATDIRLFKVLEKEPLTVHQIAKATGAEPKLLGHLFRGLLAHDVITESSTQKFTVSPKFALFQNESFENAFAGCQDFLEKIRGSWPAYLESTNYQFPHDANDTAIQYAFGTKGMSFWETFQSDPKRAELLGNLSILMSVWSDGFTQLQDLYPVQERLETGFDPSTVMFVDVGGNFGQKTLALKKACPKLPGRFIVQDLPQVIERAPKDDPLFKGIEMTAHDFFTEQPIRGARCYYIRQTLHNWHDGDVVKILKHLRDACTPSYSRILIHEIIVPDKGSNSWVACQDLTMLSMFAVGERTEADWRILCESAGLKLTRVYIDDNPSSEGIVEIGA